MLKSQNQEPVKQEMEKLTAGYQADKLEFIKNPMITEFLGLSGSTDFTESKLESCIITNIQKFLMELGKGYAFVARQQHIHTEKEDYANCHRGICVGYSLKELVEKFNCLPVVYEETLPQYTNDTSVLINTLTKYIDWKYEHEWRIVEINDKQRNEVGYKIKFVKPKEIILGLKSNDFLWKINNTGKSSDEIKPDELIRYSEDILGTDCFQYQITTSDKGYKWEKIIRI